GLSGLSVSIHSEYTPGTRQAPPAAPRRQAAPSGTRRAVSSSKVQSTTMDPLCPRRTFLAAALAAGSAAAQTTTGRPIRLGGPIFLKSADPRELAREHRRLGYSAAYCPQATVDDSERITAIREAFAAENVVLAEVGAWVNMLDPDAEKRRKNMEYVISR